MNTVVSDTHARPEIDNGWKQYISDTKRISEFLDGMKTKYETYFKSIQEAANRANIYKLGVEDTARDTMQKILEAGQSSRETGLSIVSEFIDDLSNLGFMYSCNNFYPPLRYDETNLSQELKDSIDRCPRPIKTGLFRRKKYSEKKVENWFKQMEMHAHGLEKEKETSMQVFEDLEFYKELINKVVAGYSSQGSAESLLKYKNIASFMKLARTLFSAAARCPMFAEDLENLLIKPYNSADGRTISPLEAIFKKSLISAGAPSLYKQIIDMYANENPARAFVFSVRAAESINDKDMRKNWYEQMHGYYGEYIPVDQGVMHVSDRRFIYLRPSEDSANACKIEHYRGYCNFKTIFTDDIVGGEHVRTLKYSGYDFPEEAGKYMCNSLGCIKFGNAYMHPWNIKAAAYVDGKLLVKTRELIEYNDVTDDFILLSQMTDAVSAKEALTALRQNTGFLRIDDNIVVALPKEASNVHRFSRGLLITDAFNRNLFEIKALNCQQNGIIRDFIAVKREQTDRAKQAKRPYSRVRGIAGPKNGRQ